MSEFTKIQINQTYSKTILNKFGEVSINFFLWILYFIISPPKQDLGQKIQTNQGFPPCSISEAIIRSQTLTPLIKP